MVHNTTQAEIDEFDAACAALEAAGVETIGMRVRDIMAAAQALPQSTTWQVVANMLNDDAAGEEVIQSGLTRAEATSIAQGMQRTHNPEAARTDRGLNFFIRKDS